MRFMNCTIEGEFQTQDNNLQIRNYYLLKLRIFFHNKTCLKQKMQRGRSQMHSSNRHDNFSHNAMDVFGRHDPFREMNQVMRSFGGFGGTSLFNDDFFKDDFMMRPFGDPMERMMGFSDLHQKAQKAGKSGNYVCQTFVSSSTVGKDGKVNTQSYFQNQAGENRNGNTISQKQQAYKDSQGVKRIAEERMLNDKGHKIIKQKRGNDVEQTNHYYNIEEDEAQRFHQSWKGVDKELKFTDKYNSHMRGLQNGRSNQPRQLQLGYQPSQFENKPRVESRHRVQQNNPRVQSRHRMEETNNNSNKEMKKSSYVTPSSKASSRKY